MANERGSAGLAKSGWDKADIVLKPVGGLLTALAVAFIGIYASQSLDRRQASDTSARDHRQASDTNARLYAELMSKREEADSQLRKDMFKSIIDSFLKPGSAGYEERVLNLELLSYNFHEALDLGPLFKHVYKELTSPPSNSTKNYLVRLERAARDVNAKQVAILEEGGERIDGEIDFDSFTKQRASGYEVIDRTADLHSKSPNVTAQIRHFRVEVLDRDLKKREVLIRLKVSTPQKPDSPPNVDRDSVDRVFWVGFFDFPMIDNVRLSNGQRCAIVLREFQESIAEITLVYFPGERASLKEKPFYDEVLQHLTNTERLIDEERTK